MTWSRLLNGTHAGDEMAMPTTGLTTDELPNAREIQPNPMRELGASSMCADADIRTAVGAWLSAEKGRVALEQKERIARQEKGLIRALEADRQESRLLAARKADQRVKMSAGARDMEWVKALKALRRTECELRLETGDQEVTSTRADRYETGQTGQTERLEPEVSDEVKPGECLLQEARSAWARAGPVGRWDVTGIRDMMCLFNGADLDSC